MPTPSELSQAAFEAIIAGDPRADELTALASKAYRDSIGSSRGRFDHVLDGPRKR